MSKDNVLESWYNERMEKKIMSKYNILESWYNEQDGVSCVTLQTKWGTFTEYAIVNEADKDIANRWDGCAFAHYKCMIDMWKAKARAFRERANGMNHAANIINQQQWQDGVFQYHDDSVMSIRCAAEVAERDAKIYAAKADKMREEYKNFVAETLTLRKNIRKRDQQ